MMHYGGSQDYGMGPDMMGRGYRNEPYYPRHRTYMDREDAARIFEDYLSSRHHPEYPRLTRRAKDKIYIIRQVMRSFFPNHFR